MAELSSDQKAVLGFGANAGAAEKSLVRWGNGGDTPLTVDDISARIQVPGKGVLQNLLVRVAAAFGAGKGVKYTVRVNGVDTPITCTISGAVAASGSDTDQYALVNAGDQVEIHATVSEGVPADAATIAELEFDFFS